MNMVKKITSDLLEKLPDLGLSETQLYDLIQRWSVIALYQDGKLDAAAAGALLSTDHTGFLDMLDELGILYTDTSADGLTAARSPLPLAQQADAQQQIQSLTQKLDEAHQQLTQLEKELIRADHTRGDFIATVSHELRTPLNSIIGFSKLLLNQKVGPLNQVQQTDLSLIYDSAQHLLSLVNNILDLSKIEAGKISLDMDWVTVEEIVVGVVAATYILIENKSIELYEEFEPGLPRVYADRDRIRQVVINMLSNAAKFTDQGRVTLKVTSMQRNGQDAVCFAVSDTGIGINPQDFNKVFEPFRQIDSSEARRAGGTGLGMAISYRMVQLHGGEMWIDSQPGLGSTFSFTLPIVALTSAGNETVYVDYRLDE